MESYATWGVWLPLALGTLIQLIASTFSSDGKSPRLADIITGFGLPALGRAVRVEEEAMIQQKAEEDLIKSFELLKSRYGNKSGKSEKSKEQ